MSKIAKVEGHPDLVRDANSGAVLNINSSKIKQAREAKRLKAEQKKNQELMEQRLGRVEYQVNEMLNILKGMKDG